MTGLRLADRPVETAVLNDSDELEWRWVQIDGHQTWAAHLWACNGGTWSDVRLVGRLLIRHGFVAEPKPGQSDVHTTGGV